MRELPVAYLRSGAHFQGTKRFARGQTHQITGHSVPPQGFHTFETHTSYRLTFQPRIKDSAFMRKRAAGVPPTEISLEELSELAKLVWNVPEQGVMTVGPLRERAWSEPEEVARPHIEQGRVRCSSTGGGCAAPLTAT